jgi:hypothetical protein
MNDAAKGFLIALGLALVVALGLAVWLLGGDRLMRLALILITALCLALVLAATALPIRAWRRRDPTGETHYYHDGTRTVVKETRVLDGRVAEAPKLYRLPPQPAGAFFPELLRAAYRAGMLNAPAADVYTSAEKLPSDVYTGSSEAKALPPNGWDGDITP